MFVYTSFTPVLHKFYTSFTQVLHQFYTSFTQVSHKFYTSFTQVLHKFYINNSGVTRGGSFLPIFYRLLHLLIICLLHMHTNHCYSLHIHTLARKNMRKTTSIGVVHYNRHLLLSINIVHTFVMNNDYMTFLLLKV